MEINNFSEHAFDLVRESEPYIIAQELDQRFVRSMFLLEEIIRLMLNTETSNNYQYVGVLNDLLNDISGLFDKLFSSEKQFKQIASAIYTLNQHKDKSFYYYVLCEKICQLRAIICLLLSTAFFEQEAENHYYLFKAVKNELNRVSELLEVSMIKIPEFYS